jgi:CheY-like chemotaxis protein
VTNHPILIVDDEPSILELIHDILEQEGFSVLVAHNGAAALRQIQQRPVALVLTDLMMPQISGIELARRLRGDPKTAAIPIILMSAAMPPGASDLFVALLHKPFPIEKVTQIVHQCLPG